MINYIHIVSFMRSYNLKEIIDSLRNVLDYLASQMKMNLQSNQLAHLEFLEIKLSDILA